MQCPRCQTTITSSPDASGALVCPACGARLLTRAAAAARASAKPREGALAGPEPPHPSATLPPGTPLKKIPTPEEMGEREGADAHPRFETILAELRALRSVQEEILELLRHGAGGAAGRAMASAVSSDDDVPPFLAPIRTKRPKSVLIIDDDEATRTAAIAELERAAVPVRGFADGQEGLEAIAEDKPDIIVLELDLKGAMAGKDVINMVKATMEWVDVPIILYTRATVENQREARTIHGADEFVLKGAGPAALLARCIALFRKG